MARMATLCPMGIVSSSVMARLAYPNGLSRRELYSRNGDVVGFVQMNDGILRRGQSGDLQQPHNYLTRTVSVISSPVWTCRTLPAGCTQNPSPFGGTGTSSIRCTVTNSLFSTAGIHFPRCR